MEGVALDHVKYYEYISFDSGGWVYKEKGYECDDFKYDKYERKNCRLRVECRLRGEYDTDQEGEYDTDPKSEHYEYELFQNYEFKCEKEKHYEHRSQYIKKPFDEKYQEYEMMIPAAFKMQYEDLSHFVYENFMVKVLYNCTVVACAIL